MAQAAADAAAQAGIISIFHGTNTSGTYQFPTGPSPFYCGTSDAQTPCYYAEAMNGFNSLAGCSVPGTSDCIKVDFPAASGAALSEIRVTVQKSVGTILMQLLGPSASTIRASGTAAILNQRSPVPILVTHPSNSGSFNAGGSGGTAKIQICGGGQVSIQVNSTSSSAVTWNGNPMLDLRYAGPKGLGNCSVLAGGDFGFLGGPDPSSIVEYGTYGHPDHPSLFDDPLATVTDPVPTNFPTPTNPPTATVTSGSNGCPASVSSCLVYSPGIYASDISVGTGSIKGAIFKPGIYYLENANFSIQANGAVSMATGWIAPADPATPTGTGTGWTGQMMVYMTGTSRGTAAAPASIGQISFAGGSSANLSGPVGDANYQGILFFVDRYAAAQSHSFDGGGGLALTGSVYTNNWKTFMTSAPTQYQTLTFSGNAGSSTTLTGEIITGALNLQGTPGIRMNLTSPLSNVRKVALIN